MGTIVKDENGCLLVTVTGGTVPPEANEARMALLIPSDREKVEAMFAKDDGFKALFFGRDGKMSPERWTAGVMMRLASGHLDRNACVRVFNASVWKERVSDETVEKMAKESTDLVTEIDVKLKEYRDMLARGEKPILRSERGAEK